RSRVFTLKPLTEDEVRTIVRRALADERGLGGTVALTKEAEDGLVAVSNGDARVALNALELATDAALPGADGKRPVGLEEIRDAMQRRSLVRPRRRSALRHDLGVHQERPRLRPRRGALLAHAHDRRRRGP